MFTRIEFNTDNTENATSTGGALQPVSYIYMPNIIMAAWKMNHKILSMSYFDNNILQVLFTWQPQGNI